jgi:hypothetical protein
MGGESERVCHQTPLSLTFRSTFGASGVLRVRALSTDTRPSGGGRGT